MELLYKIPFPKKKIPYWAKYIKYGMLAAIVLLLPAVVTNAAGMGEPFFCKFICPAGMIEGGIPLLITQAGIRAMAGKLFALKLVIAVAVVVGCLVNSRFFLQGTVPAWRVLRILYQDQFCAVENRLQSMYILRGMFQNMPHGCRSLKASEFHGMYPLRQMHRSMQNKCDCFSKSEKTKHVNSWTLISSRHTDLWCRADLPSSI